MLYAERKKLKSGLGKKGKLINAFNKEGKFLNESLN
jgi:hypothetical protein